MLIEKAINVQSSHFTTTMMTLLLSFKCAYAVSCGKLAWASLTLRWISFGGLAELLVSDSVQTALQQSVSSPPHLHSLIVLPSHFATMNTLLSVRISYALLVTTGIGCYYVGKEYGKQKRDIMVEKMKQIETSHGSPHQAQEQRIYDLIEKKRQEKLQANISHGSS